MTTIEIPQGRLDTGYDNTAEDCTNRQPLVTGEGTYHAVTKIVCATPEARHAPKIWYVCFTISLMLLCLLFLTIAYQVFTGVGVWGNNSPNAWAFDIINFVFWVGIAHAGTMISAVLLMFRQRWRTGINRFAEATTVFSVLCAGIYPAIHVGRPWFAYWLIPYPNIMGDWPNFYSPLLWDALAVSTYSTFSFLFWYFGMVPDLATLRDRAKTRTRHTLYGIFALGWRGSARHWKIYDRGMIIMGGLACALVLAVSSTVSTDFAVSQIPGWHETIFPPYFTVGAIFSGFATVIALAIPARHLFGLKDLITERHMDNLGKLMLLLSSIVLYIYLIEFFTAYYAGNIYERFAYYNREFGPYWWMGWAMMFCNGVIPQALWFKKARTTWWLSLPIALLALFGMWTERFSIIVTSISRDFLPSAWHMYSPTLIDIGMFAGSFGLFFTLFLLFCRYLPMVAMAEVKSILPQSHTHLPEEYRNVE